MLMTMLDCLLACLGTWWASLVAVPENVWSTWFGL